MPDKRAVERQGKKGGGIKTKICSYRIVTVKCITRNAVNNIVITSMVPVGTRNIGGHFVKAMTV